MGGFAEKEGNPKRGKPDKKQYKQLEKTSLKSDATNNEQSSNNGPKMEPKSRKINKKIDANRAKCKPTARGETRAT